MPGGIVDSQNTNFSGLVHLQHLINARGGTVNVLADESRAGGCCAVEGNIVELDVVFDGNRSNRQVPSATGTTVSNDFL